MKMIVFRVYKLECHLLHLVSGFYSRLFLCAIGQSLQNGTHGVRYSSF